MFTIILLLLIRNFSMLLNTIIEFYFSHYGYNIVWVPNFVSTINTHPHNVHTHTYTHVQSPTSAF